MGGILEIQKGSSSGLRDRMREGMRVRAGYLFAQNLLNQHLLNTYCMPVKLMEQTRSLLS